MSTYYGPLATGTQPLLSGAGFKVSTPGTYTFQVKLAVTIAATSSTSVTIPSTATWLSAGAYTSSTRTIQITATVTSTNTDTATISFNNATPSPASITIENDVSGTGSATGTISCVVNPDGSMMVTALPLGVSVTGTDLTKDFESDVTYQPGSSSALWVTLTQLPSGTTVAFPSGGATFTVVEENDSYHFSFSAAPGSGVTLNSSPLTFSSTDWLPSSSTATFTIDSSETSDADPVTVTVNYSSGGTSGKTTTLKAGIEGAEDDGSGGTTSCYIRSDGAVEVWDLAPGVQVSGINPTYLVQDPGKYDLQYDAGDDVTLRTASSAISVQPPAYFKHQNGNASSVTWEDTNSGNGTQEVGFNVNTREGRVDPTLVNDPTQG